MEKLTEEVRVGNFMDGNDYDSLVEKLATSISSSARNDKGQNKTSFIVSELQKVGLNVSKNSGVKVESIGNVHMNLDQVSVKEKL